MAFSFFSYKPDQGRFARGLAFWLLTGLTYFGCTTFYYFLHWSWATDNLIDRTIPILDIPLNPALVISVVLFLFVVFMILKLVVNKPSVGTMLIDTETEMKKVTWPTWNDAFNSSLIVIAAVVFFAILLGLSDIILNKVFLDFIFR